MLHYLVCFFLVFPFVVVVLSLLRGKPTLKVAPKGIVKQHHFACIITAYKQYDIALPLIQSLLRQTHSNLSIYLVADACTDVQLDTTDLRVRLLCPPTPLNGKVRSMQYALDNLIETPDYVVIFDPDNLADSNLLSIFNDYVNAGYVAIQGKRTAKNLDTIYACADATGEIYKNYIERQVPYTLGSSATIAGSGMAIRFDLFNNFLQSSTIQQYLHKNQVIVAEDKILQNEIVKNGTVIAYANTAIIYDEKVSNAQQVTRQRTRWLYAYFQNIGNSIKFLLLGITKLNVNQLLFGIFAVYPPLFLLLFAAMLLTLIDLFVSWQWLLIMVGCIGIFGGTILWTLYLSNAPKAVWKALWGLPFFVLSQVKALFNIRQAQHDFLTTQHTKKINIDELQVNNKLPTVDK